MARTVFDALDTRDKLRSLRAQVASLPIDTTRIVAGIDEADLQQETLAGSVVFPAGAEQSRLIGFSGQTLAFSRSLGRFYVVLVEDPAMILIETVPTNGGTGTTGGEPVPQPVPEPVPPTDGGTGTTGDEPVPQPVPEPVPPTDGGTGDTGSEPVPPTDGGTGDTGSEPVPPTDGGTGDTGSPSSSGDEGGEVNPTLA